MGLTLRQVDNEKQQIRRRATSKGLSFGPLATAITVGTVAVLIGVTFIGDWLRTPKLTAEASPTIISPNGDQTQDSTTLSYTLNEDAEVTVEVVNEANRLVRTITTNEFQTRGQHVAIWNGLDSQGQVAPDGRYRLQITAKGTMRAASQGVNVLVDTLRRVGLRHGQFADAAVATIRLKLLRLGAQVRMSVRRIHFAIASGCPNKSGFELAYLYLRRAFASG